MVTIHVHGDLKLTVAGLADEQFNSLKGQLSQLITQGEQIMATQKDFQDKLDVIDANTTASAAAAQALAANLTAIKAELDAALTAAGVPADQEAAILDRMDASINTSTALKTFLEATAAGGVTAPEPTPVPVP